jgi:hypothetical protein
MTGKRAPAFIGSSAAAALIVSAAPRAIAADDLLQQPQANQTPDDGHFRFTPPARQ